MAMVGGFNPSEKYEFVTWDDYSQLNGKIKFLFQTTNQYVIYTNHYMDGGISQFGW
jgi:accessory colonization factor AcfC